MASSFGLNDKKSMERGFHGFGGFARIIVLISVNLRLICVTCTLFIDTGLLYFSQTHD
jgi:hypothetical protein